jgi:hypothetical protein
MLAPLRSLFRAWRAALLLVAAACASPGRASAECGDYVVVLNGQTLTHSAERPPSTSLTREAPADPKGPCSGPNCSRSPDHPVPPFAPAPAPGPHGKEAAQTLGSDEPAECRSSRLDDFISPRPVRRAVSIFHPPRID